jgi:hypothetical protein
MKKRLKLAEQRGEKAIYDYSFLAKAFQLPAGNATSVWPGPQQGSDFASSQAEKASNVEAISCDSSLELPDKGHNEKDSVG